MLTNAEIANLICPPELDEETIRTQVAHWCKVLREAADRLEADVSGPFADDYYAVKHPVEAAKRDEDFLEASKIVWGTSQALSVLNDTVQNSLAINKEKIAAMNAPTQAEGVA